MRALNYILKPYEPERIASVLHTALEALDIDAEKYYVIEQKGGSIRVPPVHGKILFQRPAHRACGDHGQGIYIL